ncbi:MAG TPA: hypothetical protein PLN63_03230 [Paludibacteraceae bacterium]|jgi:short-subunit dehydrogenase|nr:hypothetical protein [Paludibacteraceae bacterium]HOU67413.1 hypothetical protein [Paludibacteraceae bacterium]HPH62619.1 hypothetical protein [Paludibacteraceae bacterium]HQF49495.1 hypothetical protein [Paludibacteraceae bacterium]HQJ90456.1 hypothetical protein [Paludibacteraceae bacterium]
MKNGKTTIAITGAAGNLGSILAKGLITEDVCLHLLWHKKPIEKDILKKENVKAYQVDLSAP